MSSSSFNYARKYYGYKQDYYANKPDAVRIKKILALIGSNKHVLDIGCYDGTISEKLKDKGNKIYGVDASRDAVKLACAKGICGVVGNADAMFPFKDDSFDVVFAGEIIEHILDTEFFIEEIKRMLKPNGFLVLTTPNVASLGRRIMLLVGRNPYFEASFGYPKNATAGHVRFFTKDLLTEFLKYKGLVPDIFESDVVNLTKDISSELLASCFPTLGRSLIIRCKK